MTPKRAPLEERISDIRAECAAFVRKHVQAKHAAGVPDLVVERLIYNRANGDPCQAALDVIATEKRDEQIARRQACQEAV